MMNRLEFPVLNRNRHETAEFCCRNLFIQHPEASLAGTGLDSFKEVEQVLSSMAVLNVAEAGGLGGNELKPMEAILEGVEYELPLARRAGGAQ